MIPRKNQVEPQKDAEKWTLGSRASAAAVRGQGNPWTDVVPCFATARDFFTDAYFRGITRTYHPAAGFRSASFTVIPLPSLRTIYS